MKTLRNMAVAKRSTMKMTEMDPEKFAGLVKLSPANEESKMKRFLENNPHATEVEKSLMMAMPKISKSILRKLADQKKGLDEQNRIQQEGKTE